MATTATTHHGQPAPPAGTPPTVNVTVVAAAPVQRVTSVSTGGTAYATVSS